MTAAVFTQQEKECLAGHLYIQFRDDGVVKEELRMFQLESGICGSEQEKFLAHRNFPFGC